MLAHVGSSLPPTHPGVPKKKQQQQQQQQKKKKKKKKKNKKKKKKKKTNKKKKKKKRATVAHPPPKKRKCGPPRGLNTSGGPRKIQSKKGSADICIPHLPRAGSHMCQH